MIEKDKKVADDGEVENESPVAVTGFLAELKGGDHDSRADDEGQQKAAEKDEAILWDEGPRRMRGSKKGRLLGISKGVFVCRETDMVLQNVGARQPVGGAEKRLAVHGGAAEVEAKNSWTEER